jgi:peptidoglycan/xylan/chitin deacetylase (PgdA/CDA1 family)
VESTRNVLNQYMADEPVKCLRPPYGNSNPTLLNLESANSLAEARWDIDPADWQVPDVQTIINRVLGAAHPGGIILMHDGGGFRGNTVAALPVIIDTLRSWGYTFVSIC